MVYGWIEWGAKRCFEMVWKRYNLRQKLKAFLLRADAW